MESVPDANQQCQSSNEHIITTIPRSKLTCSTNSFSGLYDSFSIFLMSVFCFTFCNFCTTALLGKLSVSLSLRFNGHFPGEPGLAGIHWSKGCWRWWWQLVYRSYKSCKAPAKSSPPRNQHPVFLQAGCPSCRPTNSVKALKEKSLAVSFYSILHSCSSHGSISNNQRLQ